MIVCQISCIRWGYLECLKTGLGSRKDQRHMTLRIDARLTTQMARGNLVNADFEQRKPKTARDHGMSRFVKGCLSKDIAIMLTGVHRAYHPLDRDQ